MSERAEPVSWIELGVIARPQGLKGEARVHVFNPDSTLLEELAEVFLIGQEDEEPALVEIHPPDAGRKHCSCA